MSNGKELLATGFASLISPAGSAIALFLSLVVLFSACNNEKKAGENGNGDVIASIDDLAVTEKHFQVAFKKYYKKTGQAIPVNKVTRKAILTNELNKYAVVKYAEDAGWDSDNKGRYKRQIIERKAYLEGYKEAYIKSDIEITDGDLRWQFLNFNTKVRASHLYAPNKAKADSLYQLLKSGESFENLAKKVFNSSELANSGGDLGFFTVDEMDPAFEQKAYNMEVGSISKPVRTNQGWSIIKVTDKMQDPVITEQEYAKKKLSMYDHLKKKKVELAIREDIRNTINKLQIDNEQLEDLWETVKNQKDAFRVKYTENSSLPVTLNNSDQLIAQGSSFRFTKQDFLAEAYYTPPKRRREIKDFYQFRNFVEGLIYRKHAIQIAKQSKKVDRDFVEGTITATMHNYMNNRFRDFLESQYKLPEDTARSIYREHKDAYVNPVELKLFRVLADTEEEANNALTSLKRGKSFDSVRNKYATSDPYFPSGTTQFIKVTEFGQHSPEIGKLQPGEYFGPMQWNSKYLIYKCLKRQEERPMTFEEAYPVIKQEEKKAALKQVRENILDEVKKEYNASINYEKLQETPINI